MVARFLLLAIIIASLSSFKQDEPDYFHYLNLDNVKDELMLPGTVPQTICNSKRFSVTLQDMSHKEKIEDPAVVRWMQEIVDTFKYNTRLFQPGHSFSIYSLGEMKLNKRTLTKVLYIEASDKDNGEELKILLGINTTDGRIVSVIELSRNLRLVGFSNYTYSIWHKNKFKIVNPIASDVIGPGIKHARPDSYIVRMGDDGRLR